VKKSPPTQRSPPKSSHHATTAQNLVEKVRLGEKTVVGAGAAGAVVAATETVGENCDNPALAATHRLPQ
jgi:hypothetical protein